MLILTDSNLDDELKKAAVPLLVDFWAAWCGPCKLMEPVVEELDKEYQGKLLVAKMDVDANLATAQKFGIMSIPTTIIFKNGTEAKRMVGYSGKEPLVKAINEVIVS